MQKSCLSTMRLSVFDLRFMCAATSEAHGGPDGAARCVFAGDGEGMTTSEPMLRIPAEEYHAIPSLSASGMKDLAVSPLRYWFLNINPARPIRKESLEMKFGTALHCLVLEGERVFHQRYAVSVEQDDYPHTLLVTVDDLRSWLSVRGHKANGTRKIDLIKAVQSIDSSVPIWDVVDEENRIASAGKMLICKSEFERLSTTAQALLDEPKLQDILKDGEPEVSIHTKDQVTGADLKVRMDWVSGGWILDLKTFTQKRGKSIDQTIADAIFYEAYYRQAYLYTTLHHKVTGRKKAARFVMAFVESDPPHEVRLREFRPAADGVTNVYWSRAQLEVNNYCRLWASCVKRFGDKPWREEQSIDPLMDEEMRMLAF